MSYLRKETQLCTDSMMMHLRNRIPKPSQSIRFLVVVNTPLTILARVNEHASSLTFERLLTCPGKVRVYSVEELAHVYRLHVSIMDMLLYRRGLHCVREVASQVVMARGRYGSLLATRREQANYFV